MPGSILEPNKLYLGDNGRVTCGKIHCAGMTAHFTGRALSGQAVKLIDAKCAEYFRTEIGEYPRCAGCGLVWAP